MAGGGGGHNSGLSPSLSLSLSSIGAGFSWGTTRSGPLSVAAGLTRPLALYLCQAGKPARGRRPLDGACSPSDFLCSVTACRHLGTCSGKSVQAVGSVQAEAASRRSVLRHHQYWESSMLVYKQRSTRVLLGCITKVCRRGNMHGRENARVIPPTPDACVHMTTRQALAGAGESRCVVDHTRH